MDSEPSKALTLMHRKSEHRLTLGELVERVEMSRTAFAVRFKAKVGVGPLEHLTQWRVQKACELLREGRKTLDEVARRVGYESAAAFSRVFKRGTGGSSWSISTIYTVTNLGSPRVLVASLFSCDWIAGLRCNG